MTTLYELTTLDGAIAEADAAVSRADVNLKQAEVKQITPLQFPSQDIIDLRKDREDAHRALKLLRRRQADCRKAVLASARMDDVIDWSADPFGDAAAGLVHLLTRVTTAESESGMPQHAIIKATASMAADIASRLRGHQDRDVVISVRVAALHSRLRDALDYPAERDVDARLRAKLGMPAV